MKRKNITPPVGHELFIMKVQNDCENAEAHRMGVLSISDMAVCLSKGEGRTTLIKYLVDMYKEHGVLDFRSGLDECLEFTLDGSPQQIKKIRAQIESAAVYRNHYEGIIVFDPSELAKHLYEVQMRDFISLVEDVSSHAVLVFFFPNKPNRAEMQLMDKLRKSLDPWVIEYEAYEDEEDIARIVERYFTDRGIHIETPEKSHDLILDFIGYHCLSHASEAIDLAKMLLVDVDYTKNPPILRKKAIAMYTNNYDEEERKKVNK